MYPSKKKKRKKKSTDKKYSECAKAIHNELLDVPRRFLRYENRPLLIMVVAS